MSVKIFIHGSDVTKHAFTFDVNKAFEILNDKQPLLISSLGEVDFDIFLVDFIDDVANNNGSDNGNDNKVSYKNKKTTLKKYSMEHTNIVLQNLKNIYEKLNSAGKQDKIFINKVFLSKKTNLGKNVSPRLKDIHKANEFLSFIYNKIKILYPKVNFLTYDSNLFLAKLDDAGELSPVFYVDELYKQTLKNINDFYENKIIVHHVSLSQDNSNAIVEGDIQCDFELEYAVYFYINNVRQVVWYQDQSKLIFPILDKGIYKVLFFARIKGLEIAKLCGSDEFVIE